jgi:hypothetical protein
LTHAPQSHSASLAHWMTLQPWLAPAPAWQREFTGQA